MPLVPVTLALNPWGVLLATDLKQLDRWMADNPDRVFVPTMGALHAGHVELVKRGVDLARERGWSPRVVVSVFVNPTQFNEAADYARYPKTLEADCEACERAGAACVFAPGVEDVYPGGVRGFAGELPAVATEPGLEDAHRPGHFAGVYQVVERLFRLVRPRVAVFGEKDWQQLQVVRAMVERERLGVEVVGVETVREPDGLAMSSRNRFLSPAERAAGLALSRALRASASAATPDEGEESMRRVLAEAGLTPDYAVVREAASLVRPAVAGPEIRWRAIIAARVGSVRLLDNAPWQRPRRG